MLTGLFQLKVKGFWLNCMPCFSCLFEPVGAQPWFRSPSNPSLTVGLQSSILQVSFQRPACACECPPRVYNTTHQRGRPDVELICSQSHSRDQLRSYLLNLFNGHNKITPQPQDCWDSHSESHIQEGSKGWGFFINRDWPISQAYYSRKFSMWGLNAMGNDYLITSYTSVVRKWLKRCQTLSFNG